MNQTLTTRTTEILRGLPPAPRLRIQRQDSVDISQCGYLISCGPHQKMVCFADMYDAANWPDSGTVDLVRDTAWDIYWTMEQYKEI